MFFISNSNLFTHETELNGTIPALFQYIVLLLKVISLVAHNHSCYKHNRRGC
jgi:hypothetical protein